jgi:hypothetical protein
MKSLPGAAIVPCFAGSAKTDIKLMNHHRKLIGGKQPK